MDRQTDALQSNQVYRFATKIIYIDTKINVDMTFTVTLMI